MLLLLYWFGFFLCGVYCDDYFNFAVNSSAGYLIVEVFAERCQIKPFFILQDDFLFTTPYQTKSLPTLLRQLQQQNRYKKSLCLYDESPNYGSCSFCATYDHLKFFGDEINYCGTGTFNCSGGELGPPLSEQFTIPCFNISTGCDFDGWARSCRGGYITYGVCRCVGGSYGYDCSVYSPYEFDSSCIKGPLGESCWSLHTGCDQSIVDVEVNVNDNYYPTKFQYNINNFTEFQIMPCSSYQTDGGIYCWLCLTMENITHEGLNFTGYLVVRSYCESFPDIIETLSPMKFSARHYCYVPRSSNDFPWKIIIIIGLFLCMFYLVILFILHVIRSYEIIKNLCCKPKEGNETPTSIEEDMIPLAQVDTENK